MKKMITTAYLLGMAVYSQSMFGQVGINTKIPNATLDITPKTTDGSKPEGLLIPQLDGNSLKTSAYGTSQKGVIIYAKSVASPTDTKTTNVTAEGYYYFDGTTWQKVMTGSVANADLTTGVGGIYKGSGSLSGNTTVTQGANTLAFTTTATNGFSVDGTTLSVDAANNRVGIGTSTPATSLEVNSGVSNTSGLKFTNLNSSSTVIASNTASLGVDNAGNVIIQSDRPVQTIFKSFSIDANTSTNSLITIGTLQFRFNSGGCGYAPPSSYIQVRSNSGSNNDGIVHGISTTSQTSSSLSNSFPATFTTTFSNMTSLPINCFNDGHVQFSFFSYTDRTYYRVNVHSADGDSLGYGALGYIYVEYQR